MLKMEEKKIGSERDGDESKQNKKWIESSDSNTYRLKDEERWRTKKNFHKFAHGNISEALRKHFNSIFLHENVFFNPK